MAAKKNFSISKSQPDPLGYNVRNKNPILETLADQANLDGDCPEDNLTGLKLRDDIIDALSDDNKMDWPSGFGFITKTQWIKDIKQVALEEKDRGLMKSYNVRQTLLWCVQGNEHHFTEDQLLLAILRKLSLFLKEGFLPSFLEEKRNLIFNLSKEQCKAGHKKIEEVIQRLPFWINCVHGRQQDQQRNLTELATKLKTIPGAAHFVQPGFLAKVSATNISKKLYTTDKNNEKRHFLMRVVSPKANMVHSSGTTLRA